MAGGLEFAFLKRRFVMKKGPSGRGKKDKKNRVALVLMEKGFSQKKPEETTGPAYREKSFQQRRISIDQPFDYEDVVKVTGADYVQNLHHDGVVFMPYEELRKNPPVAPIVRQECIWMKARIINFHLCDNQGDCDHCEFDLNMRRAMGDDVRLARKATPPGWADQIKETFETAGRPCICALLGRVEIPEECEEHYECFRCAVYKNQSAKAKSEFFVKPRYSNVSGYKLANDYYYHFGHLWVHMEQGGLVRVGMDEFVAKVFGKPRELRLPLVGASLKQGEVGFVMFRNGHQAPMQSPLSGKVVAVNSKAMQNPSLCHQDSYYSGWLFLLDPYYLKNELKALYFGQESLDWMERENRLLLESLGPEYERLAATGGEPTEDLFGSLPEVGWDSLVRIFLRTQLKRKDGDL
jgi:glycine cleavage system H lipoate-binding protein